MVKKPSAAPVSPKLQLSPQEIDRGISRLKSRIDDLRSFNLGTVPEGASPELAALSAAIQDTLERCFGENTSAFNRFLSAAHLQLRPMMFSNSYPQLHHYREGAQKNIQQSIVLLNEAIRVLEEDRTDAEHSSNFPEQSSNTTQDTMCRSVFVVHGHDNGVRESVARFLEQIGFKAIILHEQANKGRTIIEKVEDYGDADFAVVLLTPDDEGCSKGGKLEPRARQNVLLELGYFIGRLGREQVCALKCGELEIPSDFAGVVWEPMDSAGGWKQKLGRELQAAGHEIDWNRLMRLPAQ